MKFVQFSCKELTRLESQSRIAAGNVWNSLFIFLPHPSGYVIPPVCLKTKERDFQKLRVIIFVPTEVRIGSPTKVWNSPEMKRIFPSFFPSPVGNYFRENVTYRREIRRPGGAPQSLRYSPARWSWIFTRQLCGWCRSQKLISTCRSSSSSAVRSGDRNLERKRAV